MQQYQGRLLITDSQQLDVLFSIKLNELEIINTSDNNQILLIPYGTMDTIFIWCRYARKMSENLTNQEQMIGSLELEYIEKKRRLIFEFQLEGLIKMEQQLRGKLVYFRKPCFIQELILAQEICIKVFHTLVLIKIQGTQQTFVEKLAIFPKHQNDTKHFLRLMQIKQEIIILGILRKAPHPYIIQPFEISTNGCSLSIIYEHFKAGDLSQYLQQNTLDNQTIKKILNKILIGVNHIHNLQVIHRDLKPENIFLRTTEDPTDFVIGDFGLACDFSNLKERSLKCGTLGYMAPEIFKENQLYDYKVDIFSAGTIFSHLLKRRRNIDKKQKCQLIQESNIQTDEVAKDLLKSMLQVDPQLRPSAKECLQHPYFSSLSIVSTQVMIK